jgi:hypothetical protein
VCTYELDFSGSGDKIINLPDTWNARNLFSSLRSVSSLRTKVSRIRHALQVNLDAQGNKIKMSVKVVSNVTRTVVDCNEKLVDL